jgi:hypothetical protein
MSVNEFVISSKDRNWWLSLWYYGLMRCGYIYTTLHGIIFENNVILILITVRTANFFSLFSHNFLDRQENSGFLRILTSEIKIQFKSGFSLLNLAKHQENKLKLRYS